MKADIAPTEAHPVIVFASIMKSVSDGLQSSARGTAATGMTVFEALSVIIRGALRGSLGAGGDLVLTSKAILLGVTRATGEKGPPALKILSHTTRSVVRQAASMNADVAAAVTGLVQGAIVAADCIDVAPAKAAWVVSGAAIEEAYRINSVAVQEVRKGLATLDK